MKRHGLWQFHRAAKAIERPGSKRWFELETYAERQEFARRMAWVTTGSKRSVDSPYQSSDAIVACAIRFARRQGVTMNVLRWNDLCALIARRAGFGHRALDKAQITGHWSRCRVEVVDPISVRPAARHSYEVTMARLRRMTEMQSQSMHEALWVERRYIADINRSIKAAAAAETKRMKSL